MLGATSDDEAANITAWFPDKAGSHHEEQRPRCDPLGRASSPSTGLRALFLSRIHPTKGLLPLLVGLSQATRAIDLSIVGPVEDPEYWQQCQQVIHSLPDHVIVTRRKLAQRDEIAPLLWNSDCMVLLTAGENYGHVIAEALQAGCPVITTPTTPWTEVLARRRRRHHRGPRQPHRSRGRPRPLGSQDARRNSQQPATTPASLRGLRRHRRPQHHRACPRALSATRQRADTVATE